MATLVQPQHPRSIERRIEQVYELPPMPDLGRRVLQLQSDPNADARQLAKIVELDPSLAAQVIRYASSSYYGYKGRVTNIHEAITRVLGYDMVLNLALGLATGRSFRLPKEGPLGLDQFWRHAVLSAVLAQKIGAGLAEPLRPANGVGYLCGLLHDFGILLLGHLFPPEFQLLNKLAAVNTGESIPVLEARLLGMGEAQELLAIGHAGIGAWLMQVWKMPEVLRVALAEHHNPGYRGEHEVVVYLVQLTEFLLKAYPELPQVEDLPMEILAPLKILPSKVLEITSRVFDKEDELTVLSTLLARSS